MSSILAIWKSITMVSRIGGRMVGRLRAFPILDDAFGRLQMGLLNPIVIRRVRNPNDADLHAALDLYQKRIPDDCRFEASDIIRWLADDKNVRSRNSNAPRDFFLVAKYQRSVHGFLLFHYYPARKSVFLAYLVVSPVRGIPQNQMASTLVDHVSGLLKTDKHLRDCETLVFEVEDPRKLPRSKQLEGMARIQRFCSLAESQQLSLLGFDIEYQQPRLSLSNDDGAKEKPLLLLSAKVRSGSAPSEWAKKEVLELLSFIYQDLYPEGFSPIFEESTAYSKYCNELYNNAVKLLPEKIKVINPAHLTCGRNVRKAAKRLVIEETFS